MADNFEIVEERRQALSAVLRLRDRAGHWLRRNTRRGSRRNIYAHYDLSNDFFELFLDESMTYSCAIFDGPEDSLYAAQRRKLRALIDKAGITSSDHVVEIGCGWGAFAIEAARTTGCRVTAITISQAQKAVAEDRIRRAGFEDRVSVRLCDYRDLEGRYDKLVSVEMLEAVGHDYYGHFFAACERLLKPDGVAVLQVITMPEQRYQRYRHECDWIQKRIFPGATVPALGPLVRAASRHSTLIVDDVENIGPHYARTLREWRLRLQKREAEIRAMGFDERFLRTFVYYFAFCEAGFASGLLGTLHMVLRRPQARRVAATDADAGGFSVIDDAAREARRG